MLKTNIVLEIEINRLVQEANKLCQLGQLAQAERLYHQVLDLSDGIDLNNAPAPFAMDHQIASTHLGLGYIFRCKRILKRLLIN